MSASPDAPWALVDFWDGTNDSDGVTALVEIPGYGLVRIEHWYTRNSAGVDVYDESTQLPVNREVEEHLGEVAYEYLTGDWLFAVESAYWEVINPFKEIAVQAAQQVPIEPPSADG